MHSKAFKRRESVENSYKLVLSILKCNNLNDVVSDRALNESSSKGLLSAGGEGEGTCTPIQKL